MYGFQLRKQKKITVNIVKVRMKQAYAIIYTEVKHDGKFKIFRKLIV